MKNIEVEVNDVSYIIHALNAHDASFIAMQFLPIIASLQSAVSGDNPIEGLLSALAGLKKEKYNEIVFSLFELIKKKEKKVLCDVFKDGEFIYGNIQSDPYVYMSLLKESFMLSFKDFLTSAARAFPSVATALNIESTTQASDST